MAGGIGQGRRGRKEGAWRIDEFISHLESIDSGNSVDLSKSNPPEQYQCKVLHRSPAHKEVPIANGKGVGGY